MTADPANETPEVREWLDKCGERAQEIYDKLMHDLIVFGRAEIG